MKLVLHKLLTINIVGRSSLFPSTVVRSLNNVLTKERCEPRLLVYCGIFVHPRGSVSGRPGGLVVTTVVSGSSGPGPGRGHCVVFLGKTLYSHSTSLHPGVQISTFKFNARDNPVMDYIPSCFRLQKLG